MKNNVNNHIIKSIDNYSNLIKKPTPISILTAENTIFIKTNQNQLKANYIKNGNQIKYNKNYLSTTINQSQTLYNSLKNTFIKGKNSNIVTTNKKNLKDINNRINEFLKNIKYQGYNSRVTNSFINMDRSNNSNISSLNTINGFSSNNNHIFNLYSMTKKLKNSSVKGKHKLKKKLKIFDENKKFNQNEMDKNNINSIHSIGTKASSQNRNKKIKINSLSKKDKTDFYKKMSYLNNLSSLIASSNHDNIYYRTIDSHFDKDIEKEPNRIKRQFYYKRKINNKYIYSIEKKKEKSLAEKRQRVKKPVSYLIKNNYLNQITNKTYINRNRINLNNDEKEKKLTEDKDKEAKGKYIYNRNFNYKKKIYNIDNYNYNINVEKEGNKKIKKNLEIKTIQINNDNFNKISTINEEKSIKNNKNIVNNNYYSINNTFIFDNFGNKLNQYDLTKLINKNNNSSGINYTEGNEYIPNNFKRIDTDIENNKNFIIKSLNKKIKKDLNSNNIDNKIKLRNNNRYNNLIETDKSNNNNKLKLNKLSNSEIINLINDKLEKKPLFSLTLKNKLCISSAIKKGITTMNKNTKDIIKNKIKTIKEIKFEPNDNNKEKTLNKNNGPYLNKNPISKKYNNHKSIYQHIIDRKKSGNVSSISNKMNLNLDNDIIYNSKITTNPIKNTKIILKNEKNGKNKLKGNVKNIRQNKIISYKTFNNKIKNKSYNLEKFNKLNIKEYEINEVNKNAIRIKKKNNIEHQSKKIKESTDINNLFFNEYENENADTYEKNYFIEEDKEQLEKKQNSSFEIISLSENNLEQNDNSKNEEDNFDDINSIIKKINFDLNENKDDDIFSLNNKMYKNFEKVFDKRFNELLQK